MNAEELRRALTSDIDLDEAAAVLDELGLPAEYSDEAVNKVNEAANALCDVAADLKRAEAPRAQRKAVRDKIERLCATRALLYRLRGSRPGDVVAGVSPIGG